MMFGNNGNKGNTKPYGAKATINTSVETFFSDNFALTIGCWDDKLSIRYMRVIGKDERGFLKYDRDNRVSTSLASIKAAALLIKYRKKLKPILDGKVEKTEQHFGVRVGGKEPSLIMFEYFPDENGSWDVYLTLAKNVAAGGTCDPQNIYRFKFRKTEMVEDMNLATGQHVENSEEGDFEQFIGLLTARYLAMPFVSHAKRVSDTFKSNGKSDNTNSGNDYIDGMMGIDPGDFSSME